jgi:NAD(P)-dependent dehydrogenase (short-subunit alcohol dehydrogenase family)
MGLLDGNAALVTGAAVGLGNAFARALAAEGAALAVCDVRPEISELADELTVPVFAGHTDVSQPADVARFIDAALERFGAIDVLVNNAGTWAASLPDDPIEKTLRDYENLVGTNFRGVFLFGRAAMPGMIERGSGEIINISTDHVQTCGTPFELSHDDAPDCPWARESPRTTGGEEAMDLYDASKWGINGLTLAWSQALAEHGIRVNALCMGATDSHMLRSFFNFQPTPEDVAGWMKAEYIAQVLIDLLREGPQGRTGENIGIAVGHPIVLPPSRPSPYVILGESVYE